MFGVGEEKKDICVELESKERVFRQAVLWSVFNCCDIKKASFNANRIPDIFYEQRDKSHRSADNGELLTAIREFGERDSGLLCRYLYRSLGGVNIFKRRDIG
jgi:hypothetical protein